eukprot:g1919.t1
MYRPRDRMYQVVQEKKNTTKVLRKVVLLPSMRVLGKSNCTLSHERVAVKAFAQHRELCCPTSCNPSPTISSSPGLSLLLAIPISRNVKRVLIISDIATPLASAVADYFPNAKIDIIFPDGDGALEWISRACFHLPSKVKVHFRPQELVDVPSLAEFISKIDFRAHKSFESNSKNNNNGDLFDVILLDGTNTNTFHQKLQHFSKTEPISELLKVLYKRTNTFGALGIASRSSSARKCPISYSQKVAKIWGQSVLIDTESLHIIFAQKCPSGSKKANSFLERQSDVRRPYSYMQTLLRARNALEKKRRVALLPHSTLNTKTSNVKCEWLSENQKQNATQFISSLRTYLVLSKNASLFFSQLNDQIEKSGSLTIFDKNESLSVSNSTGCSLFENMNGKHLFQSRSRKLKLLHEENPMEEAKSILNMMYGNGGEAVSLNSGNMRNAMNLLLPGMYEV